MNVMEQKALIQGLNERQIEAVNCQEGALLVIAGAGTGKTRVITRRIAGLLKAGISGYQILAITFTNKAAQEMRGRVESLVGPNEVTLSTYHSFCARFLRRHCERVGFSPDYTIYDRDECIALIKRIIKDLGIDKDKVKPSSYLEAISNLKNDAVSPLGAADRARNPYEKEIARVYQAYDLRLRQANSMDFDDLLVRSLALLKNNPDILKETSDRYRYLLVDEYQDTNRVQYQIVKLLGAHGNVCVTGDPDQSIYAWRGADIRNILEFEKDFANARVVLLEENYRSTGNILKAASAVIQQNTERKERGLWTSQGDGESLKLMVLKDEKEEAREVALAIRRSHDAGVEWKQHAVFYRTNAQTRILERIFRESHIPYRLIGALSFFKRKEVKDLLAYLTLWSNPVDDQTFMRIVNTPRRGVGESSVARLAAFASEQQISLFASLSRLNEVEGLTARAINPLTALKNVFEELGDPKETSSIRESMMRIIEMIDYEAYLKKEVNGDDRIENIRELISAARDFELTRGEEGLAEFLADVSLMSSTELEEGDENGVTFITLHGAKGLEYDHVYFIGLEEDILPHVHSRHDPKGLEEERRLMYVGITRARKTLSLYRAVERNHWGDYRMMRGSRFLDEIPQALLEVEDRSEKTLYVDPVPEDVVDHGHWDEDDFCQLEEEDVEIPVRAGDRVRHPKFDVGRVLSVSGRPPALKVRIQFNTVGVRQLIWDKGRMEKIS
jgi:DNA helicase-2/ATP-dependent DNA helicase PcrA